jgi:2',3'-cyclic-nucleotide 2'-phosphodiesterase (5'-nucleotidase family)
MAFGVLYDFTGNTNLTQIITAVNLTKKQWFIDAVNTPKPLDLFLLIGHNPVRPSDSDRTLATVQKAIRKARPNTPIQVFGGHSHIRDLAVYDSNSVGLESGRYCGTLG